MTTIDADGAGGKRDAGPSAPSREAIRFDSEPAREIDRVTIAASAAAPEERSGAVPRFPIRYDTPAVEAAAAERWQRYRDAFVGRPPVPPLTCYAVEEATCFWPSMAVARGNTLVRETIAGRKLLRRIPGFDQQKRKRLTALRREGKPLKVSIERPQPIDGDFFLLGSAAYDNYFHWLIECLPKLALWRQTGTRRGLLTPPLDHPYQRQSLQLAGVGEDRIVQLRQHVRTTGDLIFSERIAPGLNRISRTVVPFFADLRARAEPAAARPPARRILLSRAMAKNRRLGNEAEIMAALAPLGFQAVSAETLTVPQQAALFAGAEMVVAPHGAGLANLAFCRPGTIVVELVYDTFDQGGASAFAALADLFGLTYGVVVGTGDAAASGPVRPDCFDFRVRPEAVIAMIEELSADSGASTR